MTKCNTISVPVAFIFRSSELQRRIINCMRPASNSNNALSRIKLRQKNKLFALSVARKGEEEMLQRARKRRYRVESNERCRHNWRHMLIDRHTLITSLVSLTPGCANANRTEKKLRLSDTDWRLGDQWRRKRNRIATLLTRHANETFSPSYTSLLSRNYYRASCLPRDAL